MSETYDLNIPKEGLDYDLLDFTFNQTTQSFIKNNGIKPGMRVRYWGVTIIGTESYSKQLSPNQLLFFIHI